MSVRRDITGYRIRYLSNKRTQLKMSIIFQDMAKGSINIDGMGGVQ
jgi:hypothetical protein